MYKYLAPVFVLLALIVLGSSCNKNLDSKCPVVSSSVPDSQVAALKQFIDTANISGLVKDSRGFYYTVSDTGVGTHPTDCNVVKVNYSGKLTDGTVFDAGHNVQFTLNQLVLGWRLGLPYVSTGGIIKLYLPPALGYGGTATATIPANSILIFTIELTGVK